MTSAGTSRRAWFTSPPGDAPARRYLASVAIFINQFGSGVVYVLLSAELIRDLVKSAGFDMVECYWILVIAAILCPCTFLGSPKDFW